MPGHSVSAELRAKARAMRKDMTDAERADWHRVRAHRLNGLGFRRQFPIGPYNVDFACPALRLIVEVDGPVHDDEREKLRDLLRERALAESGWRVLRFTNVQAMTRIYEVSDAILAVARRAEGEKHDR
jgi:very-short-patch-repair endonuclease